MKLWGIDFSAARTPGSDIWIAQGIFYQNYLEIEQLSSLHELAGISAQTSLQACLHALTAILLQFQPVCVALDFPFSLPRDILPAPSVSQLYDRFFEVFPEPESLLRQCTRAKRQPLRYTDRIQRVPFSPCNLRLYRQTYWGMGTVLRALWHIPQVAILPFRPFSWDAMNLVEICPASVLKHNGLYRPYKGTQAHHREGRKRILDWMVQTFPVTMPSEIKERVWNQAGGDALDAMVALLPLLQLFRRYHTIPPPAFTIAYQEGWIYTA